eukprot:1776855-Pleurochrysis_carterae.AAC.1
MLIAKMLIAMMLLTHQVGAINTRNRGRGRGLSRAEKLEWTERERRERNKGKEGCTTDMGGTTQPDTSSALEAKLAPPGEKAQRNEGNRAVVDTKSLLPQSAAHHEYARGNGIVPIAHQSREVKDLMHACECRPPLPAALHSMLHCPSQWKGGRDVTRTRRYQFYNCVILCAIYTHVLFVSRGQANHATQPLPLSPLFPLS